ncbi:MAG: pyrroloquinoline quinone biosynthesis peptide chaperone PqqD [Thiofilum sp.]|uniref:pyrroloquinoline quinone biosynthesis peptide chaperone PqqD n=1 Tax=Thiofilum sp. TaxID=2212733 RepID=UPI0025FA17E8|nr:pyrroloquinoline quinone biosynthesis peptide chaperone PqqD [Thiofilum sp.]MBK8455415.1 pyrroloquinoline quinone biosynthesis peptide chaperone PqqD [Thiofilum sp.]
MDTELKPQLALGYRLQWEPVQENHVLLYPEGMVKLNDSAAAILAKCTGELSIQAISEQLENEYEVAGLLADVSELVESAVERGWLRYV